MLKPNPTTRNYYKLTVGFRFSSSQGCRGRDLGGIDNYYNLLLYNVASTYVALLFHSCYYKLLAILFPCCNNRLKMLVFDRPSLFPLTLVLLSCSPLYNLPFLFDTSA